MHSPGARDTKRKVSVLFNESKLLKYTRTRILNLLENSFSTLQRVEIAEIVANCIRKICDVRVSVLFNESKLLKFTNTTGFSRPSRVSVLFNESKLLK